MHMVVVRQMLIIAYLAHIPRQPDDSHCLETVLPHTVEGNPTDSITCVTWDDTEVNATRMSRTT